MKRLLNRAVLALAVMLTAAGTFAQPMEPVQSPSPAAAAPAKLNLPANTPVLDLLPEGAMVYIAVPNLGQADAQMAALNKTLSANSEHRPLTSLKNFFGITAGLDESRGLGVAVLSPPMAGPPAMVILLPISDYKAFLANFKDAPAPDAEGVTSVTPAESGQELFIKDGGAYAIASLQRDWAAGYTPPVAGSPLRTDATGALVKNLIGRSQAVAVVDMTRVAPMVSPILGMMMNQMEAQMSAATVPDEVREMNEANMAVYRACLEAFIRDAQALVIGLEMPKDGAAISFSAQFKPDSPTAAIFANSAAKPLAFDRLPDQPFVVAGTADLTALPLGQLMNDMAQVMAPEGTTNPMLVQQAKAMKQLGTVGISGMQFAWFRPSDSAQLAKTIQAVSVLTAKDTAAVRQLTQDYYQTIQAEAAKQKATTQPSPTLDATFTANAKQVGGVSLDGFSVKYPDAMLQQMGPLAAMFEKGFTGYYAFLPDAEVTVLGEDAALLEKSLAAAKGEGKLGADAAITGLRSSLPAQRMTELYMDLGTLMQFLQQFAGPSAPATQPVKSAPMAMSLATGNATASFFVYVPTESMVTVKNAAPKPAMGGEGMEPATPMPVEPGTDKFNKPAEPGTVEPAPAQPMPAE